MNIDLLIENGYFLSKSEFIKTAIKRLLDFHKSADDLFWTIGILHFSKKDIESYIKMGRVFNIKVYGMLVISKDILLSDLQKCVTSIKVYKIKR